MVKPKKMTTGARHAEPGTSRDEDDLEIVPCEGHKEDPTGPTVDQEDNVSMAFEDIGDSAVVLGCNFV